jgi:hypothetical protein
MALMVHREISERINRDFDDLKVRNPGKYRELEQKYKRFEHETNFAVSMSSTNPERRR